MNQEQIVQLKNYLEAQHGKLPEFVEKNPTHWTSRLYVARLLKKYDKLEDTYAILREIYEENTFRYNKDIHGGYEEYIEEKVKFFMELAELSMEITGEAARSIPYLDEALIMLDGAESVHPYINPKDIKQLKKDYLAQIS